jgi:hypothetical protein
MPIAPIGQFNTTALTVPDVYVQIVPPQFLHPRLQGIGLGYGR